MVSWRITKYDPAYRDGQGEYQKNEWTSCYDIGKPYGGKEFTVNDYMAVENAYIDAVLLFAKGSGITTLTIRCLEKHNRNIDLGKNPLAYTEEMVELFENLREGDVLEIKDIERLCRLVLREQLWCKLESGNKMFVHFGYDYYMYIGSLSKPEGIARLVEELGLFIEEFESPYL
jgi:hypothetical protein